MRTIIIVSGGMDPIHKGHIELIEKASKFGGVHVILNSDAWLIRKKGSFFMTFSERKYILESINNVEKVWAAEDDDGTVNKTIETIVRHYTDNVFLFGNGGDRVNLNTPEVDTCVKLGVGLVWGLGKKIQSSSDLINRIKQNST